MPLQPNKNPTGWEDLPTEIKVKVLYQLRDLGSLDALFHASPSLYRTCGNNVAEYTEAIFASGYVCGHTAVIFRLCALIQSGRLPVRTTNDFFQRVTGEAMCYFMRVRESRHGIAPRKLGDDLDPAIVRGLLTTARLIQNLAGKCIQLYLARFQTLRPESNPAWKKTSRKRTSSLKTPYYYDCVDGKPVGTPHKVQDLDGFAWEEEQRAIRAIWRVQLIYELKRAVFVTKVLEWEDPQVLECIQAIGDQLSGTLYLPGTFYGPRNGYREFIASVHSRSGPWLHDPNPNICPEHEEIRSIADFIREKYGKAAAANFVQGFLPLRQLDDTPYVPIQVLHPAPKSWKALLHPNDAVLYYFCWITSPEELPFRQTSFDHFAQFGFAFWCKTRMQLYGLLVEEASRHWEKASHAWYSIKDAPALGGERGKVKQETRDVNFKKKLEVDTKNATK